LLGSPVRAARRSRSGFVTDPIVGGVALVEAINLAVASYGTNPPTLPHITYERSALPGQSSVQWPPGI
jgi:hypothetical protein